MDEKQSNVLAIIDSKDSKSIILSEDELKIVTNYLSNVINAKGVGFTTIPEGLAKAVRAKELGLPLLSSMEHICVINGRTAIDTHIAKALLLRAGVIFNKIKDMAPLYEYTDGINVFLEEEIPSNFKKVRSANEAETLNKKAIENGDDTVYVYPVSFYKDYNKNIYRSYQLNKKFKVVVNSAEAKEAVSNGLIPIYRIPNIPYNKYTEYEFRRIINGVHKVITSKFSINDAIKAELIDKDNYVKFSQIMIAHRAFIIGAREIANDLLLGATDIIEAKTMASMKLTDKDLADYTDNSISIEANEIEE